MLQSFKKISWIVLLAFGLQTSWAFSLLGPTGFGGDAWQQEVIAYNPIPGNSGAPPFFVDPLAVGPKNLGEEYRRNTPVMYYACDANFIDYFGPNGTAAIDQALSIVNNSLTNVDGSLLTDFPLSSETVNYSASAAGLLDLKSKTLALMMEQLGLADSVRYVWCLHNRFQPTPAPCPDMEYQVVMRNFDITASPLNQIQYSPYVNGSLYSYLIDEICSAPAAPPNADALEILVDPLVNNPPVASLNEDALKLGSFFTGLTRDDIAGLRYLYSTNNIIFEAPAPGSVLLSSTVAGGINYGPPFLLYSSNYTALVQSAQTNSPGVLTNLYPGLVVTSSSNYFPIVYTTNYFGYYTNLIGAPSGTQTLVAGQTVTWTVATYYADTFANVILFTNHFSTNSSAQLVTVQVQPLTGAPAGIMTTNTTSQTIKLNVPSGDYYINTNACGPNLILSTVTNYVVATTNVLLVASNTAGLYYSQSLVTYATNYIYIAQPVLCGAASSGGTATNVPGLYEGIGHIQFVSTPFDSWIGQSYQPITNTYTMVEVVNSKPVLQTFQRVVTAPDVLFTAADLVPGPSAVNDIVSEFSRNVNFDTSNVGAGLAGPGVITNSSTITFDKVGPVFLNVGPGSLSLSSASRNFIWGSFDGTTNDPVVYPNGTIYNLANQVLVQITPSTLPVGTNGVAYPATTFVATGGAFSPPFTWSLQSGGLPAGLTLSSGGTISGTPTQSGTFDFTVQLTDVVSRSVTWNYSITVN
jgi:hypothetical protein